MPQPISRPAMHSSMRTPSLSAKAASSAAGSASAVRTFVAGVGFHEERQPQPGDDRLGVAGLSALQEHLAGEVESVAGERALGRDLVEGHHRRGHRARRVRDAHHVEIALQAAVLARRAVDDDQRVVERAATAVDRDREVVLVHLPRAAVGRGVVPVAPVQVDERDVVFFAIERRFDLCGAL